MEFDLLIPFGILVVMVVYLIYSRNKFEKEMLDTYEEKFNEWKKHNPSVENKEAPKELVGLVFKKDAKIEIEVFDSMTEARLNKGKFNTEVK